MFLEKTKTGPTTAVYIRKISTRNKKFLDKCCNQYGRTMSEIINYIVDKERTIHERKRKRATKTDS